MSRRWIFLAYIFSVLCMQAECWSYGRSDRKMSWDQARTWCKQHHTDLVTMKNQEEIDHLKMWLAQTEARYWIGIRKIDNNWMRVGTNKPVTNEDANWREWEPNDWRDPSHDNRREDCVEASYYKNWIFGKWNDLWCDSYLYALCYTASCQRGSCVHGRCVEKVTGHRCECFEGFDGDKCQHVVQCSELTPPPKGHVSCTGKNGELAFDSQCRYSCDEGYELSDPEPLRCTATRNWSHPPPTCEAVECSELTPPPKGHVSCTGMSGDFAFDSQCRYSCDEGYELSDPQPLRCTATRSWSHPPPTCEAIECEAPPNLHNGAFKYGEDPATRFLYGHGYTFTCDEGYQKEGPPSVTCTSDGQWSATPYCQAVQCDAPPSLPNGAVSSYGDDLATRFSYGNNCTFRCDSGYQMTGPQSVTCTSAGLWSEMPHCEPVQCYAPPSLPNGAVSYGNDLATRFSYGNNCTFRCDSGYQMKGPQSVTCTSAGLWSEMPHCERISTTEDPPAVQEGTDSPILDRDTTVVDFNDSDHEIIPKAE